VCASNFVCHNRWVEVEFAVSARRHRVGKARALHVIHNPRVQFIVPDPAGRDDRIILLGDDQTGRALEVMGVELADGTLYVIHVMDMRAKYRSAYEEGTP